MTAFAAVAGAGFGLGLFLLVAACTADPATVQRWSVRRLVRRVDRVGVRGVGAVAAAAVMFALTGWPVGSLLVAAGVGAAPSLRAGRDDGRVKLDAIATWTEQLRDVMAAAAGLEQAIVATAPHAPPAIRGDVAWLAAALDSGTTARTALRRFAQRLDDPAGDVVVAALILAAEGSPRQLGDLLGRLADTTRDSVRMRLRVETGRARTRSSVRVVTTVTVVFSVGIVVLNPTYVAAYRSPAGQVVLVAVAACFAGAYRWLARAGRTEVVGRFLATDPATAAVPGRAVAG